MKKKKLFITSDEHGHYTELITALEKAGFDENNPDHLLINLGDMFDRGSQSSEVYEYLKRLNDVGKAICLKGNHENFIVDYLKGDDNPFNFLHNGVNATLDDFLHQTRSFEMYSMFYGSLDYDKYDYSFGGYIKYASHHIKKEYPKLLPWLEDLPHYFETKNYIFTHASIDTEVKDWHYPEKELYKYKGWEACHWDDGAFINSKNNTGKTVVVGHFGTGDLRDIWQVDTKNKNDYSILNMGDKIFIDGCTVLTKNVNVLVLEDELL